MPTDIEKLKANLAGGEQALTDPATAINGLFTRTYSESAANSVAATAVTESILEDVRRAGIVKTVTVTAPIAVTGDPTNNAVITVSKRTIAAGAAGSAVTIATFTTTANLVAFVPFVVPLTAANVLVGAADVLTYSIAKGGTGVALTAATSFVKISVDVEEN